MPRRKTTPPRHHQSWPRWPKKMRTSPQRAKRSCRRSTRRSTWPRPRPVQAPRLAGTAEETTHRDGTTALPAERLATLAASLTTVVCFVGKIEKCCASVHSRKKGGSAAIRSPQKDVSAKLKNAVAHSQKEGVRQSVVPPKKTCRLNSKMLLLTLKKEGVRQFVVAPKRRVG